MKIIQSNFKHIFPLVFINLFLSLSVNPQSEQVNNTKAILFDEFSKINAESLEARLDYFLVHLQNAPNSKGKVVIYRGSETPRGFPIRYEVRIKTYLTKSRGFNPKLIEIIYCGTNQPGDKILLFSIPPNYQPPTHGCVVQDKEDLSGKLQLFDSFWYQLPNEGSDCCVTENYGELEKRASLDALAEILKENKEAKARLVFYSYKCVAKVTCRYHPTDSPNLASKVLQREKNYLIKQHKINPSRVTTVNGGYKEGEYSAESRRLKLYTVLPKVDFQQRK